MAVLGAEKRAVNMYQTVYINWLASLCVLRTLPTPTRWNRDFTGALPKVFKAIVHITSHIVYRKIFNRPDLGPCSSKVCCPD
eukprot:scaffold500197_cov35-Prasinocladus_malaysianus.AAC.2